MKKFHWLLTIDLIWTVHKSWLNMNSSQKLTSFKQYTFFRCKRQERIRDYPKVKHCKLKWLISFKRMPAKYLQWVKQHLLETEKLCVFFFYVKKPRVLIVLVIHTFFGRVLLLHSCGFCLLRYCYHLSLFYHLWHCSCLTLALTIHHLMAAS